MTTPRDIASAGKPGSPSAPRGDSETPFPFSPYLPYLIPIAVLLVLRFVLPLYTCDDAYISLKVGANLADGRGMAFNMGDPIYVTTSPLWVLLLAGMRVIVGDIVLSARILGLVSEVLLLIALVRLSRGWPHGERTGCIAAVLLVTNPVYLLVSASGMELPLYLLAIVLSFDLVRTDRSALALAVAAAGVWVRFDGLLLFGVVAVTVLILQRHELKTRIVRVLLKCLPGLGLLLGYALFGLVLYGSVVPASVQAKTSTTAAFLSTDWLAGARATAWQFGQVCLGKSSYWYKEGTPLFLFIVPFLVGLAVIARRRGRGALPLTAFSLLYLLAFTAGGNAMTLNFPWYFVPILPAASLVAAAGLAWILAWLAKMLPPLRTANRFAVIEIVFVAAWTTVLYFGPIKGDAQWLAAGPFGTAERERVYAAAGVWAGRALQPGARVAINEIGTLGFYLPPEMTVVDISGLLRRREDMSVPWLEYVKRSPPEVMLSRNHFKCKREILAAVPAAYVWYSFRLLDIGIRRDIAAELVPRLQELPVIYEVLDMTKE